MSIHSTAIVHPQAEIGEGVVIGPFTIIGPHVRIGAGTEISSHCVIEGRTVIGRNNRFSGSSYIGVLSQDLKHAPDRIGRLEIGDGNHFREFVTVSASTIASEEEESKVTRIGSGGLFMANSHIAHDCIVGDRVIMANSAALSGHVIVEDRVIFGGLTGVHQFCRVGQLSFLGGMSRINQDVLPYMIVEGNPARCHGPNTVGLSRNGLDEAARKRIKQCYRLLSRSGLNVSQAVEAIREQVEDSPERNTLLEFIGKAERGITR